MMGNYLVARGFTGHITRAVNKGREILRQLRRFSNLTPKLKTTLVKTLLIPVLEYPAIPICMAFLSQKRKMQIVLNKAVRFVHCNEDEHLNTEQLPNKYNIFHQSISIHSKAPTKPGKQ